MITESNQLAARRRLSPRVQFLVVAGGLYLLWLLVYEGIVGPDGRLDAALSDNIAVGSAALLRLLGFSSTAQTGNFQPLVTMDGLPAVLVGTPCNGLVIYSIFAAFIVAFPGHWRAKLWFVPLGVAALYLLNIGRVAALALNHHYYHRSVEFNHHYTFTLIVYGCIGGLWLLWVNRYGAPAAE